MGKSGAMRKQGIEYRAVRVSMVTGLSTVLSVTFQLVSVPVCLHYWGQTTYGHWLALFAAFQLIRSLDAGYIGYVGNQLNLLYHRDVPALRKHLASAIFGIAVLATLQLFLGAGALYSDRLAGLLGLEILANGGAQGQLGLAILLLSWILTGSYIGIVHRLLIPAGLMAQAAWWSVVYQIANFTAIMVAAFFAMNLLQTSLLFALSQAAIYLLSAIYVKTKIPEFFPWWRGARLHLGLADLIRSTLLTASNLIQQVSLNGVVVLISVLAGPAAVPVFTTVRTLANLWTNVTTVLTTPLLPDVVRFHARGETHKLAATMEAHWVLVGSAVNMGVLLSYPLLPWLYAYWTTKVVILDNPLLCLLLASVVVANTSALMTLHLNGINSLRLVLVASVLRAGFSLGMGSLCYAQMGLAAFGLGILAGEIVAGLVTMRFFYRHELVKREYKLSRTAFAPTLFSTGCVLLYLANRGFGYTSETWIWPAALMGVVLAAIWGWKRLPQELTDRFLRFLVN